METPIAILIATLSATALNHILWRYFEQEKIKQQIVFSKLHEERSSAIKIIYIDICKVEKDFLKMTMIGRSDIDSDEKENNLNDSMSILYDHVNENKILFNESLIMKLDDFYADVNKNRIEWISSKMEKHLDERHNHSEVWKNKNIYIRSEFKALKETLIKEFRIIFEV